ncbi:MAG: hypothetical protein WDZ86_06790 [Gammaproteobacteria bacterium]
MKSFLKQLGQGMTEYIIIVALIAIAAIAAYGFFGDTLRGQVGAMSQELAGQDGTAAKDKAVGSAGEADAESDERGTLDSYTGGQQ